MKKKQKKSKPKSRSRRLALKLGVVAVIVLGLWGWAGEWYVHHSRKWLDAHEKSWPRFLTTGLAYFGNPLSDITDALAITGHDAVYEYDEEAPVGSITFAGLPKRIGAPAPGDITILDRCEFIVGWSPSLRHPVFVAYHVANDKKFEDGKRPSFLIDKSVASAPRPEEYSKSGYDRGHMAPNHAIVSRYGEEARRKTFLMSNIAPQSASLNRAVWRELERRIADLWTSRYGEIWVIVGALPSSCNMRIGGGIDVPSAFFMVVTAQEGMDVRSFAVLFPNNCPWDAWAARYLLTIDELEELTGLDFNPDLPDFIQTPLEAELPTRLWPIRKWDIFRQILIRYNY